MRAEFIAELIIIHSQIDETAILNELVKHPEHTTHWLNWSDNKRTTSGWYFKQDDNSKCVVGYFPASDQSNKWNIQIHKKHAQLS